MNGAEPLGNRVNPKAWSNAKRPALVMDFSDIPTGPPTMNIPIKNRFRSVHCRSWLLGKMFGQQHETRSNWPEGAAVFAVVRSKRKSRKS